MQDAEKESFASWRTGSRPGSIATGRRSSVSQPHHPQQQQHGRTSGASASSGGTLTPMSGGTDVSAGAMWLDQRPSADTPLPGSSVAAGVDSLYKGGCPILDVLCSIAPAPLLLTHAAFRSLCWR